MSCKTLSDSQLADLLHQGDEEAFSEIYRRFWKKVYNESYKRLKDSYLAEDIVQNVFADLWVKRLNRNIENLNAYLISATRYQVFMIYKKTNNQPLFEKLLEYVNHPSLSTNPVYEVKELRDCINNWIHTQPKKRREIFRLKFIEDKTSREISQMLNISQKTVKNQFTTSMNALRDHISKLLFLLILFYITKI